MNALSTFHSKLNIAIIGSSGGIGSALYHEIRKEKNTGKIHSFSRDPIISDQQIELRNEDLIKKAALIASEKGPLDLVILTTGVLHQKEMIGPEKSLKDLSTNYLEEIFAINTIGPALIMKHFLPHLNHDKKSVFAALSARVGSIEDNHLGGWYGYRASKAALNMMIKTASIEVGRKNKLASIIGLHPGTVKTELSAPFHANIPEDKLFKPDFAAKKLLQVINGVSPDDTGKVFAWDGTAIPY
jgi:NAD(P)-dependent dehydrogenase (short-subunit alcohol dehydrogenase family)